MDLARVFGAIERLVADGVAVADGMRSLIDECETMKPHADWTRFRALPYGDLTAMTAWLQGVFEKEPPAAEVNGLWFGLFNPIVGGETVTDLYVSGSTHFSDDAVESNEWTVSPEWFPDGRDADSSLLAEIHRIAKRPGGLKNNAEFPMCLGYAALAVQSVIGGLPAKTILGDRASMGVVVGFDSGDWLVIGRLGRDGWQR